MEKIITFTESKEITMEEAKELNCALDLYLEKR